MTKNKQNPENNLPAAAQQTPGWSRGRDSLALGRARGRPGVGTHSPASMPRVDTRGESPGVPDPPRTGASVIDT